MWAEPDCYAFSALQFVPTDLDKGQVGLMLGSWIVIPMPCLWSESYMLWSVIPMPCLWSDICSADMLGIYIYALKRHPHALLLKWYICSPQICWAYIYIYMLWRVIPMPYFEAYMPCLWSENQRGTGSWGLSAVFLVRYISFARLGPSVFRLETRVAKAVERSHQFLV